jgi:geranylgeranyl pyrophosphate synthase
MAMPQNQKDASQDIELFLADVQALMASALRETPLRFLVDESKGLLANGKMLRSRLPFRVGPAAGVAYKTMLHAATATEMIHSASLLHDDVIDGGFLRRGAPAFWVEKGISGAILLGDMLLFKALDIICQVEHSRLAHPLVKFTGEVCQAESEQELIYRGHDTVWENCVRIARCKTGALFAFVAFVSGGQDAALAAALKEAGYLVGTAYQLSDDILDAKGIDTQAGKTLGTDSARDKNTAMTFLPEGIEPVAYIEALCNKARERLTDWPDTLKAWDTYMELDLMPGLRRHMDLMHA